MEVRRYQQSDAEDWDLFCQNAPMSTFLHTRKFLEYHGTRFQDASLVVMEGGKWLGVIAAAISPQDVNRVVSHPGVTYGGIIHQGALRGQKMVDALGLVIDHYAGQGIREFIYKAIPHIYHRAPAQDETYALFRLGAIKYRSDLSCTIDMGTRYPLSSRRKRSLKKALTNGVEVHVGKQFVPDIWKVLQENLERKHDAAPVHTEAEIMLLQNKFPENIQFVAGVVDGRVEAGVVLFITEKVFHAQYICSSDEGYQVSALDAVFAYCIQRAQEHGALYFDFGTSNEEEGKVLNDGLYKFKSEFGGGGVSHDFYKLTLSNEG